MVLHSIVSHVSYKEDQFLKGRVVMISSLVIGKGISLKLSESLVLSNPPLNIFILKSFCGLFS